MFNPNSRKWSSEGPPLAIKNGNNISKHHLAVIFSIASLVATIWRKSKQATVETTHHEIVAFTPPPATGEHTLKSEPIAHDFTTQPPVAAVARVMQFQTLVDNDCLPIHCEDNTLVVASLYEPSAEFRSLLQTKYNVDTVERHAARRFEITSRLQDIFEDELLHESVYGLKERDPAGSAFQVITTGQRRVLIAFALVAIALTVAWPRISLQAFILSINGFLTFGIMFKFIVSLAGARNEHVQVVSDEEVHALNDDDLPVYTVLVPAYRESNVVGLLMNNMRVLDWPAEKLQILLLLEADDEETLAVAQAADLPDTVSILTIPDAHPKTKPKACNFGLQFARGEYVVIYDAEDKPDRDQLKKAYLAFKKGGERMVCVQAALNYFNRTENSLTRMFTLEYSFWFDYMLPGLSKLGLPIPLGGTSNHFRTDMLRELGAWDPFNVTEDADLGIRASAKSYIVGVVNSTTYEEANKQAWNWIRQRSRWIKGYMQTTLVHTRRPRALIKAAGWKQSLGFLLLIGGTPATFIAAPPLAILSIVQLFVVKPGSGVSWLSSTVLGLSLFNFLFGNAVMIYLNVLAVFKRRYYDLVLYALLNPLYWNLHIFASYKAAIQLITKPFYWEKTNHGLTEETIDITEPNEQVAVQAA